MRTLMLLIILLCPLSGTRAKSDANHNKFKTMKMNAGIVTELLTESKNFYQDVLDFEVAFENDFYLLLHTPDHSSAISFLKPNHPSQHQVFQPPFQGKGMYLTIEVEKVDEFYEHMKKKPVKIIMDIRDEPWGDRHFIIQDPNGISIDIVTYSPPEK